MQSCSQHIRDLHITYRVKVVNHLYVEYSCRVNSSRICEAYFSLLSDASLNPGLNTSEDVVSVCAPFHAWVNSGSNFWPSKLEYLSVGQDFESIFELNLN